MALQFICNRDMHCLFFSSVLREVGSDHFGGTSEEFSLAFKDGHSVSCIWHMVRNLHRNGRKHGDSPRLRQFPLQRVVSYIFGTSLLPTELMFHVFWKLQLRKLKLVDNEFRWAEYFETEYLEMPKKQSTVPKPKAKATPHAKAKPTAKPQAKAKPKAESTVPKQKECVQAESQQQDAADLIKAKWFYGMLSNSEKGYGPWQQPIEQTNRTLKRYVTDVGSNGNMLDVCQRLQNAVKVWLADSGDAERTGSLIADSERIATTPSQADKWMSEDHGALRCNVPGLGHKKDDLAGISLILSAFHKSKSTPEATVRLEPGGSAATPVPGGQPCFYVMKVFQPGPVNADLSKSMVNQLRATTEADMIAQWVTGGILTKVDSHEDVYKIKWSLLREQWIAHCVVSVAHGGDGLDCLVDCSCFYARSKGHCPHQYAVSQICNISKDNSGGSAMAAVGPSQIQKRCQVPAKEDTAGSSGEEPSLPANKRRRRRR